MDMQEIKERLDRIEEHVKVQAAFCGGDPGPMPQALQQLAEVVRALAEKVEAVTGTRH